MTDGGDLVEHSSAAESGRGSVNPYATSMPSRRPEPNSTADLDHADCFLAFDGEITADDIRRLIPERKLWICLAVLMWGFLIPAFGIGALVAMINAFPGGFDSETMWLILCCVGVSTGFAAATQYVSPARRTQRALKQRPDLLGRAVGRFVPSGLLFQDGMRTHFLDANYCKLAHSNRHGVRVPLQEGPYVQLYFARRLFEQFDGSVWKQLQTIWRQHDASQLDPEAVMESNCKQLGDRSESAISFGGQVSLQVPVDHAAVRRIMYRNGALIIFYGVAMSFAWNFGFIVIAIGFLLLLLLTIRYFYNCWLWMAIPTQEMSWRQKGWISADEVVSVTVQNGVRLSRGECLRIEWIEETMVWHLQNNRAMYFSREHFASDEDWNQVCQSGSPESSSSVE